MNTEPIRGRRFRRQALVRDPAAYGAARRRRILAVIVSSLLVFAVVLGGGLMLRLRANFQTAPLSLSQSDSSSLDSGPLEILLLGTDTRTGENASLGGAEFTLGQGHSDVMMLLQISSDRKHITVVSFPRDTLVPLPECTDPKTGKVYPAQDLAMLNYALSYGGPGCTVAAVNKLTGLTIDHFMMADFTAVKEISKAVGGVDVCLNAPVRDPFSGLNLPAGVSQVEGDQALAFLRTRHGFTNGGDIGRIRAQQAFMASLVRKIKSEGTLTNLPRLYSIADSMTKNLTVDSSLSNIPTLIAVSKQLNDARLGDIAFVTLPTKTYEPDPNRLAVDQTNAQKLFKKLREEESLTAPSASASPSASSSSTPSATGTASSPAAVPSPTEGASGTQDPTAAPDESTAPAVARSLVPVSIVNSSGKGSRGGEFESLLQKLGYVQFPSQTESKTPLPTTQILFQPGYEAAAQDLAEALGIAKAQLIQSPGTYSLQIVVGTDFASGDTMGHPTESVSGGLSGQTAEQVTCQQANPLNG